MAQGANADLLSSLEYDGYVWLDDQGTTADNADPAHLPWQVLPRSAASVTLSSNGESLTNAGQAADLELYSLMATSPNDPASSVPGDNVSDADFKAVGVATYRVPAGLLRGRSVVDLRDRRLDLGAPDACQCTGPVRVRLRPRS